MKASFAVTVLVAMFATCGCGSVKPAQEADLPVVEVAPAIQRQTHQYREWEATLDGYYSAQIRSYVEGSLLRSVYREGSFVKEGDILFEVNRRDFPGASDQPEGRLWTEVVSPIDGIVGASRIDVGELINSGTILTTVSSVDWIKAFFSASRRDYLGWTRRSDSADRLSWRGPGSMSMFELILPDGERYGYRGDLVPIRRIGSVATDTVTVTAVFPNPDHLLRPGQRGTVRAAVDVSDSTLMVPQRAIFQKNGTSCVAVVGPDNVLDIRGVRIGERVGALQVIEEGVGPGELVVLDGFENLESGFIVRQIPAKTGQPAPVAPV
jgi:multidrug efflux pump subunit AcrA (membrane-fusion protein)